MKKQSDKDMNELKFVTVLAKDWMFYEEQHEIEVENFKLLPVQVAGFLIHEDDEKLVIASHFFSEANQVRHTTVIPQVNIIERMDGIIGTPKKGRSRRKR